MPSSARVDRVPDVLTPSTTRFPFVHPEAGSLFAPDACLRLSFLFGGFRARCATFQAPIAVDRPCDAISWLTLQSPHRSVLGKSCRVLAELQPRDRALTKPHSREEKEQLPAKDVQLRLVHCASICVLGLARFLRLSYGRGTPRSRVANRSAICAILRSGFRQTEIWRGQS